MWDLKYGTNECIYKTDTQTDPQGEGHVTTEAGTAVMQLQAQEYQGLLATPEPGKKQGRILL